MTHTNTALSLRQEQLVYSKRLHPDYQADRSPIWLVSPAARLATPTHRVSELAQPKSLQPNYRPCRQVSQSESSRLHVLSKEAM